MNWNDTGDNHVFSAVIGNAKSFFQNLSETDWVRVQGNREVFATVVSERYHLSEHAATILIGSLERSLNFDRFAF